MNWEKYWDDLARDNAELTVISRNFKDINELVESGRNSLKMLEKHWDKVEDRSKCLDFGCGIARVTIPLSEKFESVTGIDISGEMLKKARTNCNKLNIKNIDFNKCNGVDLSNILDDTFSFVWSLVVLQHIEPDNVRDSVRKELMRVLKPGGWMFCQDEYFIGWRDGLVEDYKKWGADFVEIISESDSSLYYWVHKKDTPTISVIIPTYNQAKYIDETIDSILKQTIQSFEIVIVNDGSTDNTLEVLEKYKSNKKIRVITQENKKLPSALNTGLKHVSGSYIAWISSDSYYHPKAFEVMLKALNDNPNVGLVSTHFEIFGDRKEVCQPDIGIYRLDEMKIGNYVGCCFLFRRECYEKIGFYDETLECVEDWDYWIRISQYWPLLKIYGAYAYWRDHSHNMTNKLGKNLGVENSIKLMAKVEKFKRTY